MPMGNNFKHFHIDYFSVCLHLSCFYSLSLLWFLCLTPLSTIFQLYRGDQFYWWMKLEFPEKTTDLCKSLTLYHIMMYRIHLVIARFELTEYVVIDTNCIGRCKFKHFFSGGTFLRPLSIQLYPLVNNFFKN